MSGVKEEKSISLLLRLDLEFLESTPKTLINSLHATARNFDTPSYWTLTKKVAQTFPIKLTVFLMRKEDSDTMEARKIAIINHAGALPLHSASHPAFSNIFN